MTDPIARYDHRARSLQRLARGRHPCCFDPCRDKSARRAGAGDGSDCGYDHRARSSPAPCPWQTPLLLRPLPRQVCPTRQAPVSDPIAHSATTVAPDPLSSAAPVADTLAASILAATSLPDAQAPVTDPIAATTTAPDLSSAVARGRHPCCFDPCRDKSVRRAGAGVGSDCAFGYDHRARSLQRRARGRHPCCFDPCRDKSARRAGAVAMSLIGTFRTCRAVQLEQSGHRRRLSRQAGELAVVRQRRVVACDDTEVTAQHYR